GKLFEAVFSDNVLECYRKSLNFMRESQDKGLRLKLMLHNAAELADMPWEFLFDSGENRFIAQSHHTPVVRYTGLPEIPPFPVKLPLRMLVAISSPADYPPLDVEGEISRLRQALAPLIKTGRVKVKGLMHVTFRAIQRILRKETFHIFHFIGHGGFDAKSNEGVLVMEDEQRRSVTVGADRIGALLHDHRSLRLAVLNCCEGARVSLTDPFAGVATALIQQGIPAVAAMQFPISDDAAKEFADEFYAALTDGFPADAAMAEARKAVFGMPNDAEWGTPVLYMRSADGMLFKFEDEVLSDKDTEIDISEDMEDEEETESSEDVKSVIEVVSPEIKIEQPKRFTNSIGMEFVWIPPGEFMMGSPEGEPGRYDNERLHRVKLIRGFYIQTTPVTQGQWKALMKNNPSRFKDGGDDCPVEMVSWNDAQEFIKKLNLDSARLPSEVETRLPVGELSPAVGERSRTYRLPTEAEWEYACRAGTDTPFCFGRCLSTDEANYDGNYPLKGCPKGKYREKTTPVKTFPPNDWGLYDMHGNVWEWCQDWYGDYPSGAVTDPAGPDSGSNRVGRGGSWLNVARLCRSARRSRDSPGLRYNYLGFRLLLPIGQQR
ncbi:MAG: hypothetical protein BWK80_47925, partial [Desulfobacteraceae bacterium IS3]